MVRVVFYSGMAVVLALLLACSGATPGVSTEATSAPPCCSVEDVIKMSKSGLSDEVILASLQTATVKPVVSAADLIALKEAGVSDPVILALQGAAPATPTPVAEPSPAAKSVSSAPAAAPAAAAPVLVPSGTLNLATDYKHGDSNFQLSNRSNVQYNDVRITINGRYFYSLKRIPAFSSDRMRIVSFIGTDGRELTAKEGIVSMRVEAKEGKWSHSF